MPLMAHRMLLDRKAKTQRLWIKWSGSTSLQIRRNLRHASTNAFFLLIISFSCDHFAVVQSLSHVQLCATPWTVAHQASLSFTVSWSLLKLMSTELVMLFNHLILCYPLLLPLIFPSIRVFSNALALCIRWPKYWTFSISPSYEYSGLISFRIDLFDLVVQGTLKSLP